MRKANRICKVCGVSYYACPDSVRLQNWRSVCDTPEHYQVYQALIMYSRGMIDARSAADMLAGTGITPDTIGALAPQKQDEIRGVFAAAQAEAQPQSTETYTTDADKSRTTKKARRSVYEDKE